MITDQEKIQELVDYVEGVYSFIPLVSEELECKNLGAAVSWMLGICGGLSLLSDGILDFPKDKREGVVKEIKEKCGKESLSLLYRHVELLQLSFKKGSDLHQLAEILKKEV